jgi:ketosteroid isomerase-like protein
MESERSAVRDTARTMSEENIELVTTVLAQWEQGNFWTPDAFDRAVQVRWMDPIIAPAGGETNGLEELARGMVEFLRQWEKGSGSATAERVVEAGEGVVSVETWRGRGKTSGVEVSAPQACIWSISNGKITRMVRYGDPAEALEAAGLSE